MNSQARGYTANTNEAHFCSKELETAQSVLQQSLELMAQLKDPEGIAEAIHNRGELALYNRDYTQARLLFEQSLELRRKLGNHIGIAASLNALGRVFILQEKYDKALPLLKEGLQPLIAHNLFDLAVMAHHQGRLDDAKSLTQLSLETFQRLNSPRTQAVLQHLADLEAR